MATRTKNIAIAGVLAASALMAITYAQDFQDALSDFVVPENQKINPKQIEKWYKDAWNGKVVADVLPVIPRDKITDYSQIKQTDRTMKDLTAEEISTQRDRLKSGRNFKEIPKWMQKRLLDSIVVSTEFPDLLAVDLQTGQFAKKAGKHIEISVFFITPHSITKPVKSVDGKIRGRALFPLDKKLYSQLNDEDKVFFKALSKELSRNVESQSRLHVLEIKKGDYYAYPGQILDTDSIIPPKRAAKYLLDGKSDLDKKVLSITGVYHHSYRSFPAQQPDYAGSCSGYSWQGLGYPMKIKPSGTFIYNKPILERNLFGNKIGGGRGLSGNAMGYPFLIETFLGVQKDNKRIAIQYITEAYTTFAQDNDVKMGVPPKKADKYTAKQHLVARWGVYLKNYEQQILNAYSKLKVDELTKIIQKYGKIGIYQIELKHSAKAQ